MKKVSREFINLAYSAMQRAYEYECGGDPCSSNESAKKIGEVLQIVGDLSREG